jgi:hypothetical protein
MADIIDFPKQHKQGIQQQQEVIAEMHVVLQPFASNSNGSPIERVLGLNRRYMQATNTALEAQRDLNHSMCDEINLLGKKLEQRSLLLWLLAGGQSVLWALLAMGVV